MHRESPPGNACKALLLFSPSLLCLLVLPAKGANCLTVPQWHQVGPGPLVINSPNGTDGKGPDSGMVRDIAIDPSGTSDQIIYVATDSGGLWKTTNLGASWTPLTDLLPSPNIGAVALDPVYPSTVYAGTGNSANQFSSIGAGIYKSSDGGQSWTVLSGSLFTNLVINRIVVPLPGVVLVATSIGVYRSVDGGAHFGSNSPNFDNSSYIRSGFVTDLDVDTAIPSTVYASIPGAGIFKSTDAGATFPSSGNLFSASNGAPLNAAYIAFAQSTRPNNQTLYIHVGFPAGPSGYNPAGLYKSTDGGNNWSPISLNTGSDSGAVQIGYAQTVGVDPQDANRVFIGARGLYEATDGGASGITSVNRIDLNQVHSDQHALVFSPASHWKSPAPTPVYNGSDGGIATTGNAGPNATWNCLNGATACEYGNGALATVLFRQIDMGRGSPANNAYIYGVAQDLGVSAHQPNCVGTPWTSGSGGDGISIAVDPRNPRHAIVALNGGWAQSSDAGQNGAQSWQANLAGLPPPPANGPYTGLVYFDPNGTRVYAVALATQLYQSTDNGNNFALIKTFPPGITALGMSPVDSNTLWVGLADGTIQHTSGALSGAAAAWTSYTIANKPGAAVSGLALDPGDAGQVVVVYRATSSSVFRTANGGGSWTMISGNLPGIPINAVVIDPNTIPHAILVATDTGVLRSLDMGNHWDTLGAGLPIVHCTSLALDATAVPSLVRVGTYGRSSFELAYYRVYVNWQNTGMQDGSQQNPFQTALQGVNATGNGDVRYVNIQAGTYAEAPTTYNQCCTLNALNGPVTIH